MDNARFVLTTAGITPRSDYNTQLAVAAWRCDLSDRFLRQARLGRGIINR
jgi:hypothetical protein